MNGELAILEILLSDTTVSGIVSDRVYLDQAAQGDTLPYVVIEGDSDEPNDSQEGASAVDYGRVRVFPYSSDSEQLRTLSAAIRTAIEAKASGIYRTVNFDYARFISQSGFTDEIENRTVFAKDQEYEVRVIR